MRPLSHLTYKVVEPDTLPPSHTVIALHGYDGNADQVVPIAQQLGKNVRISAPEAARRNMRGRLYTGHSWFSGPLDVPDSISFGDSLAQLERFVHDELARLEAAYPDTDLPKPFILGYQQGASLALGAAGSFADLVSGVIAIGATVPSVRGWDPPLVPANGLPVLLVDEPGTAAQHEAGIRRLQNWGARVSVEYVADANEFGVDAANRVRSWFDSLASMTDQKTHDSPSSTPAS